MVRILDIEKYAKENHIPIMLHDGIDFLCTFIKEKQVKKILEIGSAIGYSSIKMALLSSDIHVTTIERDNERYEIALKNINDFKLENQIKIINDDVFNIDLDEKFDLIFIDGAKSQYIKFFEKFDKNLKTNGYIISDNLSFHGLVESNEYIESRNVRGLVRKIRNYIEFLKNNERYETLFYEIGDGISVSKKINWYFI